MEIISNYVCIFPRNRCFGKALFMCIVKGSYVQGAQRYSVPYETNRKTYTFYAFVEI